MPDGSRWLGPRGRRSGVVTMWSNSSIAFAGLADPRRLLPPREGSLILVLGGTAVLVLSLTVALISGRRPLRRASPTPSVGPRPKPASGRGKPANAGPRPSSRLAIHELLLMATARAGLGTPQIVTANPGPSALILVDRLSTGSASATGGCGWKREKLEQAVCRFVPGGRVVEVSCGSEDDRACIFEVRTGDVGP